MTDRACPHCGNQFPLWIDICPVCSNDRGLSPEGETTRSAADDTPSPSVRVGRYRILEAIGEGGMGQVYLAEQEYPFRRRVALKVIKLGMETREVIARFEAERQALALMDHPCIAQVYDAGATIEGKPYFAMEYVAGVPITQYCDKHRLPIQDRLNLFVQVCGAIQHAHQKGVIHRDIKPSNILVTVQDGKPQPKVIDFGVAKATRQRLTEMTLFTQHGVLVGTPAYMSPEQAEMSGLSVDTTTDIYSLGVVLYELLIGAPPFDPETLRRAGYAEILRIIREEEPLRPSARLSTRHHGGSEVALQRRTKLSRLVHELKGDLDWITLKAMDKDRTRRYAAASELAADVKRHLEAEPVIARPPSLAYRAGKFVRKYKAPLISIVLSVAVFAVASTAGQLQSVLRATAHGMTEEAQLIGSMTLMSISAAVSRNPSMPWTAAVSDDESIRTSLQSATFAPSVVAVAVCDKDGRPIVASFPMAECPSGRPVSELSSVSLLTLVRQPLRSAHRDYVFSSPLFLTTKAGSSEVGSIRVHLSRALMDASFRSALERAVISCVGQVLGVAIVTTFVSWVVFRRGQT
jgi:serine/threonine protein kinase